MSAIGRAGFRFKLLLLSTCLSCSHRNVLITFYLYKLEFLMFQGSCCHLSSQKTNTVDEI